MKISNMLNKVFVSSTSFLLTTGVYAADPGLDPNPPAGLGEYVPPSVVGEQSVIDVAERGIKLAILLAALVCVAVLVGAGYSYITAAGDEQKVEKATKTLTYAIVGLVICFIAVILVQFVLTNLLKADASLLLLYV